MESSLFGLPKNWSPVTSLHDVGEMGLSVNELEPFRDTCEIDGCLRVSTLSNPIFGGCVKRRMSVAPCALDRLCDFGGGFFLELLMVTRVLGQVKFAGCEGTFLSESVLGA